MNFMNEKKKHIWKWINWEKLLWNGGWAIRSKSSLMLNRDVGRDGWIDGGALPPPTVAHEIMWQSQYHSRTLKNSWETEMSFHTCNRKVFLSDMFSPIGNMHCGLDEDRRHACLICWLPQTVFGHFPSVVALRLPLVSRQWLFDFLPFSICSVLRQLLSSSVKNRLGGYSPQSPAERHFWEPCECVVVHFVGPWTLFRMAALSSGGQNAKICRRCGCMYLYLYMYLDVFEIPTTE